MKGWVIAGQAGQMDCHVFFRNKRDAQAQLKQPHPDPERRLVFLTEGKDFAIVERVLREIDRLYQGQPRANFLANPTVRAIKRYLKSK